ncbi:SET domain-containing protein [Daldinia eschscholtzii]|nr:SET domain-containing protein [Daldinia eschscholtzii]
MKTRAGLLPGFLQAVGLLAPRVESHAHISAAVGQCPLDLPEELQTQAHLGCPHPVDGKTADRPVNWSPWTHPPECVDSKKKPGVRYCVYSNSQHGNGGISLITTPETAASTVEILNDSGYTHLKHFVNSSAEPAYEVADIPGKGKGVVATRHIKRAEAIMADWAALIVGLDFPTSITRAEGYRLLHKAVDQLADPDRVLSLAYSSAFSGDIVEDILRTNSFSFTLADESHMALYPDVSRVNHACRPNSYIRFTPSTLAVSVVALRDIKPGEEITITYVPLGNTRDERQEALQKWGFECTCSLCTASKTEIAVSDYRRAKIKALRREVMKAVEEWDGTRAVKLTHEVLELMKAEDLSPLYSSQYEIMARLYWKAKDKKTATKYAQMSIDVLVDQGYLEDSPNSLQALLKTFD